MNPNRRSIGIWAEAADRFQQSATEIDFELKTKSKLLGIGITKEADFLLLKTPDGWKLTSKIKTIPGHILIDFIGGKNAQRKKFPGAGKQPLAKAIGIKNNKRPTILDATAGLGGDAFLMASLGCKLWLCERNPIVMTLLTDAVERAKATSNLFNDSMLILGKTLDDAQQSLVQPPDVIYLDPMYPKPNKKRSANVKKEMQILRELLTPDTDAAEWLKKARNWSQKVVVKRPSWADPLAKDVHGCVESKNHRYDIFLGKNRS